MVKGTEGLYEKEEHNKKNKVNDSSKREWKTGKKKQRK